MMHESLGTRYQSPPAFDLVSLCATVAQAKMGLARKDWVRIGFSPRPRHVLDFLNRIYIIVSLCYPHFPSLAIKNP